MSFPAFNSPVLKYVPNFCDLYFDVDRKNFFHCELKIENLRSYAFEKTKFYTNRSEINCTFLLNRIDPFRS